MQFLKKNYEKILLGLVLFGLVLAVGFLVFKVSDEKQALATLRNIVTTRPVKPLEPLPLPEYDATLKRVSTPIAVDFSTTNKVFNPVRWLKPANDVPRRVPAGSELEKVEIVNLRPLYFNLTLERIDALESGPRFGIVMEQQAAPRAAQRARRSYFVSPGERRDPKDPFTLREVKGTAESPLLSLEMSDTGETISISKERPFRRVDGYMADLKNTLNNQMFRDRRVGDKLYIAGEEYKIVAINQNEVVLSAANQKKYTIRHNAAP